MARGLTIFSLIISSIAAAGCSTINTPSASSNLIFVDDNSQAAHVGDQPARQDAGIVDLAGAPGRSHFAPSESPEAISGVTRVFDSPELNAPPIDDSLDAQTIVLEELPQDQMAPDYEDLWDRIRQGFTLNHDNTSIAGDIAWFARNQAYLDRVAERAQPYLHYIVTEAEKRDMPLEIALLPVVESAFQPFAYSHGRAAGIWQFIPGTGRLYGLKQNWWYDGRRDIYASTQAALNYLKSLYREFGDWELALASYNSGAGTVKRAIRKNQRRGKPTDYWSLALPKETEGYVPKLLAISAIVSDPEKYGIDLKTIPNAPYLTRVDLDAQLDLALAAELADLSVEELYTLNPGFNRWATDPKGSSYLMVPLEKEQLFREQLASLPAEKRIRWEQHRIGKGETIIQIADQYNTTVQVIKEVNKLRGNSIHAGRYLIIPVAMKDTSEYSHTEDKRRAKIQNTARAGRNKSVHMVSKGDTFWDIARTYDVNVGALAKWNGMSPRDPLSIGQKLVVWTKDEGEAGTGNNDSDSRITSIDMSRLAAPPESATKRWINYIVRRGDSLARIAERFRVSISQVKSWNKVLKSRKYLQPGQRIKLYVDVTRQS